MLPDGIRTICRIQHVFPAFDLYYADPAQPLTTAGEKLHDLDNDLSSVDKEKVLRGGEGRPAHTQWVHFLLGNPA